MRYIQLEKPAPGSKYYEAFQKWEVKASKITEELHNAPDMAARKEIIDRNQHPWGDLKDWLLSLSDQKCWFSEAKDCFSHWDVEHFRPKKSAKDEDGNEYDGYWWLAFDWQNFRICGNAGNRKKGTYFPVLLEANRVGIPTDDLRLENPLLLDPSDPEDPNLLFFDATGRARPAPYINNEWDKKRVEQSIKRCNLDFNPLVEKRRIVWNECWQHIQQYRQEIIKCDVSNGNSSIAKHMLREKAKAIREMIKTNQELSSVARACILSSGDPRVIGLLS
jgi:uncharacterized protein (TIGR02646 family)